MDLPVHHAVKQSSARVPLDGALPSATAIFCPRQAHLDGEVLARRKTRLCLVRTQSKRHQRDKKGTARCGGRRRGR